MKKLLLFISAALCSVTLMAQRNTVTISGHITDSESGETLIGAGLLVENPSTRTGAVTNVFGYYTLTVPKGSYNLMFSYVGYESISDTVNLQKDTVINVVMSPSIVLKEAVVVASRESGINSTFLGAVEVPITNVKNTPVLFGEADVLKAIQMMPGVQGGNEGFTGLYVRGGGPDENLVLLDGVPIYNVDHMMGILSVFQTEAVKKVTLYKGSFPARYSGRVSSVVDIRTNDGNMKETHGSVGIGALTDKFHIEGPIIKDKLSYSVSARGLHTLFYDPFIRLYLRLQGSDLRNVNYYFYDLNGKVTWRLSDKDRFIFGGYSGRDKIGLKYKEEDSDSYYRTDLGIGWGNDVASVRWNHIFNNRLFSNTTVAFNRYRMLMHTGMRQKEDENNSMRIDVDYNSGIRDWSARIDFDYVPDPRHLIKFGSEYIFHTFSPEILSALTLEKSDGEDQKEDLQYGNPDGYYGHDISAWIEDDISLGKYFTLNPGLNISFFYTDAKPYVNLQPRLSAKYSPGYGLSFKGGYARMAQYVHLLSSSSVSLPMDLWVPITKNIKPVTSDQFSVGAYYDGLPGWEFSVETYYKSIHNLLEYKDGTINLGSSTGWEDKVEMGDGRSMGLEFLIQKTAGNFTGWLAYTLAKSDRIFPDGSINLGERFPYKYDRRHNVNINLTYKLNKRIDLNAAWSFATGGTTTVPVRKTVVETPDGNTVEADYVAHRNNFRLPPSHRLNIGMNVHTKKGHGLWNFGVYNVYNYMNPNIVLVNFDSVDNGSGVYEKKLVMNKVTILPILPSISYTYEF